MKPRIIQALLSHIDSTIQILQNDSSKFRADANFKNVDIVTRNLDATILRWRTFRNFVIENQNKSYDTVEDGAIVRLYENQWCYIYKFATEFYLDDILIKVDPGNYQTCHSIQGSRVGDKINLEGDGRAIPDRTFHILEIL